MNILTYPILACATCMSTRGEATTEAAGMAILLMLIILAGVFGGIFKFMRYLSRCERKAVGRR